MKENTTAMSIIETEDGLTVEVEGKTLTLSELTSEQIVELLNAESDLNKHAPMKKALDEVLKAENKMRVNQTVEDFANQYTREESLFWEAFINAPFADVLKLDEREEPEDGERYALSVKKRRILFTQVDKVYAEKHNGQTMAQAKHYPRLIARFTDNLYRRECDKLSKETGEKSAVIRVAYNGNKSEDKIAEVDFGKTSKTEMKKQLQAVVDAIMPSEQSVPMITADLNFVIRAFAKADLDSGKVKTGKETVVERIIFTAIRKRKNGEAYEVESNAKCHAQEKPKKSERTEKQEEVMSKVPDRQHENEKPEQTTAA